MICLRLFPCWLIAKIPQSGDLLVHVSNNQQTATWEDEFHRDPFPVDGQR